MTATSEFKFFQRRRQGRNLGSNICPPQNFCAGVLSRKDSTTTSQTRNVRRWRWCSSYLPLYTISSPPLNPSAVLHPRNYHEVTFHDHRWAARSKTSDISIPESKHATSVRGPSTPPKASPSCATTRAPSASAARNATRTSR